MSGKNHVASARGARASKASALAFAAMTVLPMVVAAQADMAPTNGLPNPYQTIEGWAKMPTGRTFASSSSVEIDADGTSVWVAERCGTNQRGCLVNSDVDPIMKFDAAGNMVTSFGKGIIVWPHGIDVDPDGNVWVVDGQDNRPQGRRGGPPPEPMPADQVYGHQVIKFSPTGQVLMRLGRPGGVPMADMPAAGPGNDFFWQPNDVYVAGNGDIFVAEGHGQGRNRVIKFNSRGDYLMEWGRSGAGPGEFNQPHALAMDSQGRLFVADRGNNRIQIFDQNGALQDIWHQFSRLSGIFIDANDVLYGADSESGSVNPDHGNWFRGIRVGSAKTGEVMYLIPDPNQATCSGTCTAEGVAADINGVIYGAEVGPAPGRLQRYIRR
jgi:sugar lactone lactonase YvrE